jgi:hypothetical protein
MGDYEGAVGATLVFGWRPRSTMNVRVHLLGQLCVEIDAVVVPG